MKCYALAYYSLAAMDALLMRKFMIIAFGRVVKIWIASLQYRLSLEGVTMDVRAGKFGFEKRFEWYVALDERKSYSIYTERVQDSTLLQCWIVVHQGY